MESNFIYYHFSAIFLEIFVGKVPLHFVKFTIFREIFLVKIEILAEKRNKKYDVNFRKISKNFQMINNFFIFLEWMKNILLIGRVQSVRKKSIGTAQFLCQVKYISKFQSGPILIFVKNRRFMKFF